MPSLIDRVNNIQNPSIKSLTKSAKRKSPNATKYSGGWSLFDSLGGTSSRTGNIMYSENGAAQAYGAVTGVQAAIRFYWDAIGLLKLQVKSNEDVRWDSGQAVPQDANAFDGASLVIAMHDYRLQYKHDYLSSIIFSDMLYAETYTYVQSELFGINTALRWLNPLAIEPDIRQGKITGYRYSGEDGYDSLSTNDVAYRIYNRNPFDDNRGLSRVLSALDAINIERNAKIAIGNFFSNGMILGGVASPSASGDNAEHLMPQETKQLESDLQRNNQGTHNAHKWIVSPIALNLEQFEVDTMDKHYDIVKSTRTEVMMSLGVPKELVGDSEGVSYENAEPVMKNWLKIQGRAYATSQLDYLNLDILPKFEPDSKAMFTYDFSAIDRREADKVVIELNSGLLSLDKASVELGQESDPDIAKANIRLINGVPFSKDHLLAVASGQAPITTSRPDGTSITSGRQPDSDNTPVALGDVPTKEILGYHIDAGIVDINEARAQIGLKPKAEKEATDLQALQAQFSVMATAAQAGIPPAISSLMVGLDIPSETPSPQLEEAPEEATVAEAGKHVHSHDLSVVKFEPNHETPLLELIAWQRVVSKNHKRTFAPIHLRGDLGDTIQLGLDSAKSDIKAIRAVFELAKKALATKAIQATRLDFEGDFDNLMEKARTEGNNYGRTQWSSAMRKILRRYGKMAYIDGLTDGGVIGSELSEADLDTIVELNSANSKYVTNLGEKIFRDKNGISDALAEQKAAQWFNGSINPFYQAGILSADRNGMYEWTLGNTENHCTDCKRLDGQRHRYKDWIRKIGSLGGIVGQDTECGGHHCDCRGVKVKARARGKF